MTKTSVLSSITFWSPGAWNTLTSYVPQAFGTLQEEAAYETAVKDVLGRLYDASPEVATILDNLAASGALRIGASTAGPAFSIKADATNGVDSYLLFDPNQPVWSISEDGSLFQMSADVILAHELGHTIGKLDPETDGSYTVGGRDYRYATDMFMNTSHDISATPPQYAYTPDVVQFENQVANELGITEHRVSYDAAFTPGSANYNEVVGIIATEGSLTHGALVDIVRFGDQDPTTNVNNIDFTGWSTSPDVLAFGMTGDDSMKAGSGNTYFFGGIGQDNIQGGTGDDRLHGGADDDQVDGRDGSNYLYGDGGNDHIYSHGVLDIIDGGADNDVVKTFGPSAGDPAGSSSIHFEDGRGVDVVEMQDNSLVVLDLSKYSLDEITIIAGGEDVYGTAYYTNNYTQFEFLTFATPGGDKITFTDDLLSVGPSTAVDWSKIGTSYAADHLGPLSVQFADGSTIGSSALWDYIDDFADHSNVIIDLFAVNHGRSYVNTSFSSMSGADYLNHINSDYFVPDNVT